MEKISHRITLDVHKGGIQKVLHGMFTGDVLSRKIVISLVAGSAVCTMDENTTAVMYVTKPSGVTNYGACTVEGNLVTYDILPADIDEPGITQMQLKVISGEMVLYAPMFSVEAQKNSSSDTPAETSPQFSALEQALAQVEEVYNKRIVSVEVEEDYTFVVTYADGETYTSDAFKALMEEIEKAEHERAEAEVARDVAEENRELAESVRASSYADMQNDIQGAIDANTALYNRVEELADEGLITESRVIEIIEEQGGGGGGGTVVLPDNVLVASDVTAADVEAPKINADLFGSLTPDDYAKTTDVNAIITGTQQVGNSKTLDGHNAEYFLPKKNGVIPKGTSLFFEKDDNSTLSGNVRFEVNGDYLRISENGGKNRGAVIKLSECLDWLGSVLLHTGNMADHVLPLSGGTLTDLLRFMKVNNGNAYLQKNHSADNDYGFNMTDISKDGDLARIEVWAKAQKAYFAGNDRVSKELLHTGNKPTGTYTGTGGSKTIATGGIGNCCIIQSVSYIAFIGTWVGFAVGDDGKLVRITPSEASFNNGSLTVACDVLNYNGGTYYYLVP